MPPRQSERGRDRPYTFGDHAARPLDLRHGLALREGDAERAITREAAHAREDEVPHAGEAGERGGGATESNGQARDLRQSTGDQGGACIVAQPETVGDSRGDGNDVLERASRLHADHVAVGVETELARSQALLENPGEPGIACGHHGRRGPAQRHLARERRSREHGDGRAGKPLGQHLAHARVRDRIEALGRGHDGNVGAARLEPLRGRRHELRGHGHQHDLGAVQGVRRITGGLEPGRDVHIGQEPRIPAMLDDARDHLGLARPQARRHSLAGEVDGQRRPPAPRPDHGHAHVRTVVITRPPAGPGAAPCRTSVARCCRGVARR